MKNRINEFLLKYGYCYVIVQSVMGSMTRIALKITLNSFDQYRFKMLPLLSNRPREKNEREEMTAEFAEVCFAQWEDWMYKGSHLICVTAKLELAKSRVETYTANLRSA